MNEALEKFANSKFMNSLQKLSTTLSTSPAFSTLSGGMGATMGLIMIGAVIQVICAIGGLIFGWQAGQEVYDAIYAPYNTTMGILAFFMVFSLAYTYAKKLKMSPLQSGFTAMVCFLLVCAPIKTVTLEDGSTMSAINASGLGAESIFVAILIGLLSVRISKFVEDHNWVIHMPDSIPEGIMNSFNSIIPAGVNIIIWYGLAYLIEKFTGTTLAYLIIGILSIPVNALVSPIGMVIIVLLSQFFWFFGIHGTSVIYSVIMIPMIAAYTQNAELAAAGQPLVFSYIFLMGCNGIMGGAGNTFPLCVMGLNSKSKQIKSISRASVIPGFFGVNEPVIFGYPIMYNPLMLIPFLLCPVAVMGLMALAYHFQWMSYPSVLVMTCLPIILQSYITTFDWRNVIFAILMFPVCYAIWYPFYKMYEKQCVEQEKAEEEAELAEKGAAVVQ